MATLVGLQNDFMKALSELLELEYDASEAYKMALEKIENQEYKKVLTTFFEDHNRHIKDISNFINASSHEAPPGPDNTKQWLVKGKVFLANLVNDESVLGAMDSNEEDTNTAYERMCGREDLPDEAKKFLSLAYEDEKRHKSWLDQNKS